MKKVIILGAGIYQVPLIRKAREKDLYVIVISIPGNYPGFELADQIYYENTTDYKRILEIARAEKADAIVTTGTDVAVITIGYVCDALGIPGLSFESARKATNKALMKEALKAGGVTTSDFYKVTSVEEALKAADRLGYPVMLKIVDKSGSRGITKVTDQEPLREAYRYAMDFTDLPYLLVEKFTSGREIGIDAFVQDGIVKAVVPHEKLVFQTERTGIPLGHLCPMEMSTELEEKIYRETVKCVEALGLNHCAVNIDAFITDEGDISVIEATGRCGATGIPEMLGSYLGIDYYEAILDNALGNKVEFPMDPEGVPTASYLLHSEEDGVVKEISYRFDDRTLRNEDLRDRRVQVSLDVKPGDRVEAFTNGTKRIGQAVFSADTREELLKIIHDFEESLKVELE